MADIADGATIAIAGFGTGHRFPSDLILALREKRVQNLSVVCNSLGSAVDAPAQLLVDNHQVGRLVAAFSARPGARSATEDQIASGELTVELVPQGTLVERLRAAGAGVAAFYTRTGVGTDIAAGKETRRFGEQEYILEQALPVDFALLRAHKADRLGNLEFRGGSANFNPSFAKAAQVAIAEVDEIVEAGELDPARIGLPGIFVTRVVKTTAPTPTSEGSARRRGGESRREYDGKPALSRLEVARRAACLLRDGSYVNLGLGIPTLVSNWLGTRDVVLHAENGILGYGGRAEESDVDIDVYNAGGEFVTLKPGACFFESVTSFEMVRSGKVGVVMLGAYQVDERGSLANWSTPAMVGGGIGGAMDLVAGTGEVVVLMEHVDSEGRPKLVERCTYPLTGRECVDTIVTDLALLRRVNGRFELQELAAGFDIAEVLERTEMDMTIADDLKVMQDAFGSS